MTINQVKEHLTGLLHGGTLNKVRNINQMFERVQNSMLSKVDPIDTIRVQSLSNTIHDDIYNYSLPSDYKKIIDLIPQNGRNINDSSSRILSGYFDLQKNIKEKKVSIEGSEGSKIIRINWRSKQPKTLNQLNSLTANGTWSAFGTSTGLIADNIDYVSGNGSIKFDLATTGDGIQNTSMTAVNLTDEDEVADLFMWFKVKNSADLALLTSVSLVWGNDLTTNYWTSTQTVQADGSAFKIGWNIVKFPWSTATETGTVAPSTIDSAKITFATTGAIEDLRLDNITVSIGRNFDLKYYSKYIFRNTAGTLISQPTTDDDEVLLDNDAMQIFLLECVIAAAQQMEGADSTFDINFANGELWGGSNKPGLYGKYRAEYPGMSKKATGKYGSLPARGRW